MENINILINGYSFKKILGKLYCDLLLTYKSKNVFLTKRIGRKNIDDIKTNEILITIEIKLLNKLSHKNIMKLEKTMKTKKHYYIVMEYCNEGSLRENLENTKLNLENLS